MPRQTLLLTFFLLACIASPANATGSDETNDAPAAKRQSGGWGANRLTLVRKGKKLDRGLALYTADTESPGVAFRCHRQQLYAFVSVKPVSFRKLLTERFRNPAEWQVEYRVDGGATKVESWIWTYGGKVFMSRPGTSAIDFFRASVRGAKIEFQRKHGDLITVDVPPVDDRLFDAFLQGCDADLSDGGTTRN